MSEHIWKKRIYYSDTDAEGIIYHAAYIDIAEHARTEMVRERAGGITYREIAEDGVAMVLKSISISYRMPGHLGDIVTVHTRLKELKTVSCVIDQVIESSEGTILAEVSTRIAFVNPQTLRPAPCHKSIAHALHTLEEE